MPEDAISGAISNVYNRLIEHNTRLHEQEYLLHLVLLLLLDRDEGGAYRDQIAGVRDWAKKNAEFKDNAMLQQIVTKLDAALKEAGEK